MTNGEYRPNDILTENQMIEKFGVSKSPVREALVELCKDGVLIRSEEHTSELQSP